MKADIVTDLLFGDAGKGLTTDYLASKHQDPIVVRYCSGPQAGHNVVIGDKSHIHSNFGSGTLRGVPSYFSEHCLAYPPTMMREWHVLKEIAAKKPSLSLHPLTKIIAPADIAYGRWKEKARNNHGSCGLGIGSTMHRNDNTGYKLYAIDLLYPQVLKQKVQSIENYYYNLMLDEKHNVVGTFDVYQDELKKRNAEWEKFLNDDNFPVFHIHDYEYLKGFDHLVFEGAQGILLDMDHGIFPNVTYANTTSKNAIEICDKLAIQRKDIEVYYLTRCYQTRHGNGWMSNENSPQLINFHTETNNENKWQEKFRIGELDYDLLTYAIALDRIYSGDTYASMVVTCLDQRPGFKFDMTRLTFHHQINRLLESYSPDSAYMMEFKKIRKTLEYAEN